MATMIEPLIVSGPVPRKEDQEPAKAEDDEDNGDNGDKQELDWTASRK